MSEDKRMKVSYIHTKSKYLIVKEDGTSELLNSKEEFDNYIKINNCHIVE